MIGSFGRTANWTLMSTSLISSRVINDLTALFNRNGYVRPPAKKRLAAKGTGHFRRGFEFRLTATSKSELRVIRKLLRQAGFKPGRPFTKGRQFRQPVYGRQELERFLEMIEIAARSPDSRQENAARSKTLRPST